MPQPMTKGVVSGGEECRTGQRRQGKEGYYTDPDTTEGFFVTSTGTEIRTNVWLFDCRTNGERRKGEEQ